MTIHLTAPRLGQGLGCRNNRVVSLSGQRPGLGPVKSGGPAQKTATSRSCGLLRATAMLVLLAVFAPAHAQDARVLAPPDMSSPRATLNSFLEEAVRLEALYSRSRAEKTFANVRAFVRQMEVLQGFFDLSAVPPAFRRKVGSRAATELIDILVRLPPQDLNAAPGGPQYDPKQTPAYWVIPNTEIALARMTDGPNAGQYRIAAEMLERLPEFHSRIIDQPPLRPTAYPDLRSMQVQSTGPLIPEICGRRRSSAAEMDGI